MPVQLLDDKVALTHHSGASSEVYFFGATVTSWKVGGQERLFLSKKAILDGTKGIRGGIPIVFPQFATAKDPNAATAALPQHGTARISRWEWLGTSTDNESEISVRFGLTDSQIPEKLKKAWQKKFKLIFIVTLTMDTLNTSLHVKNEDSDAFDFNVLFHTYFAVPDISKVSIHGLSGLTYIDKVANNPSISDSQDVITIDQEVDRIYPKAPNTGILIDFGGKEKFALTKTNLHDTVVWNPWIAKAEGMSDFGNEEYKKMICVEAGTVATYINLKQGETWEGGQALKII
ncbi:hypothetical protein G9A89_020088 [Geosiphon pyriformis]|nr:hypothetical protein G9A89_020088 [Geosiphon pyriformis]